MLPDSRQAYVTCDANQQTGDGFVTNSLSCNRGIKEQDKMTSLGPDSLV